MVFSSNVFLFLFLPLFLALYYASPQRWRNAVVVAASYLFYAWWRADFLLLFAAVTVWNYQIGRRIAAYGPGTAAARRWLIVGVVADLAVLGYFKYANFGVDTLNALLGLTGNEPLQVMHVILPIGISFYIFESISYIADVYRGDTPAARNLVDFATFVALFPHLIAGPVFRYKDLANQFARREHSWAMFSAGSVRFMQGFIKKVFIADSIAPMANSAFALAQPTAADAWLGTLAYTAQLYFDFSGYSDMAIGLGLMIGFRFTENFNQPYISQSITEFWRRWHMSLSSWLRDYLYVPLGGNRHGTFKTYRNLFLTMLLGGLWHGANWTFAIWGAWHGALLALERVSATAGAGARFSPARWATTFLLVMLGWVMFRAPDVATAGHFYLAMFGYADIALSDPYAAGIDSLQLTTLALAYVVIAVSGWRSTASTAAPPLRTGGALAIVRPWAEALMLPLFALAVLRLSAQSYSPFLYFQF
ncbi:MAG: MBOAT family protein [Sinimarinibacterium sp.]|jgi:alginate O-acetyltransferase complex protein AlgI